jgi:molecular chaperone IbpA
MRTFDLTPMLKSSVGFDVFDSFFDNTISLNETNSSYPPYNIMKSGNSYTITMAIAGFSENDIDISLQENEILIKGSSKDDSNLEFLHKGIATRGFERKFRLADTIKVTNASYENGLLNIFLEREVPEHQKPRKIEINKDFSINKN